MQFLYGKIAFMEKMPIRKINYVDSIRCKNVLLGYQ